LGGTDEKLAGIGSGLGVEDTIREPIGTQVLPDVLD
jgi:hypothetical protein